MRNGRRPRDMGGLRDNQVLILSSTHSLGTLRAFLSSLITHYKWGTYFFSDENWYHIRLIDSIHIGINLILITAANYLLQVNLSM